MIDEPLSAVTCQQHCDTNLTSRTLVWVVCCWLTASYHIYRVWLKNTPDESQLY